MIADPTCDDATDLSVPESLTEDAHAVAESETDGDGAAAADAPAALAPLPATPIIPAKRTVSGRYRYQGGSLHVELRVDVDGRRPMKRVSGDLFAATGATTRYFGSFIVKAPTVTVTPTAVTIQGLGAERPAAYTSAYIGYGKDGFSFAQPGVYQLRGSYVAPDGSRVLSPALTVRVRSPHTTVDEEVAELLMGEEQGRLFYLLGSDSDSLEHGNDAFDLVRDKYADHPLAVYTRLVKGINAERDFKQIGRDKAVTVRKARASDSIAELSAVVSASAADRGVDNITLNMAMRRLARAHKKAGDVRRATATMDEMVDVFTQKRLSPHVLRSIAARAEREKESLAQA